MVKKIKTTRFKSLRDKGALLIFCFIFAAIGVAALVFSKAASNTAAIDVGTTTPTGNAQIVTETGTTSGNTAVEFGTVTATGSPSRPMKIMPLGDSITEGRGQGSGIWVPGGYRTVLWNKLVTVDKDKINFVGSHATNPDPTGGLGDNDQEGWSGKRIDELQTILTTTASDGKDELVRDQPDLVLLHLGTNDVLQSYDMANAPARLKTLATTICTEVPGVHIVIASIIKRSGYDTAVNTYNAAIPGVVTALKAASCNTDFFDMNKILVTAGDIGADNTHPTKQGYDKMGAAWYGVAALLYSQFVAAHPAVVSSSPSGEAMPVGNIPATATTPGWNQTFSDDFTTNVALGSWPGSYSAKWTGYGDNTPSTCSKSGGSCAANVAVYYPSKVLSVSNGTLDMYLHTENGSHMAAAPQPNKGAPFLYGRYSYRFKSDSLQGFKTAWLLWPATWSWTNEVDFPEGSLSSTIGGYGHCEDLVTAHASSNCMSANTSGALYTTWHTATVEWVPGKITFFLDGKVVGTQTTKVASEPMRLIMQTEACFNSPSACPADSVAGHLDIDWVTMYSYVPPTP